MIFRKLLSQALCVCLIFVSANAVLAQTAKTTSTNPAKSIHWIDARDLNVEGKGWTDTKAFYDRLPAKAEGKAPGPVWNLSHDSSGMHLRFVTDATNITVRWSVTSPSLAMPHMSATGVSGVDLYVKLKSGDWHWVAVGSPKEQTNTIEVLKGIPPGKREYLLYLPLYNGTKSLEIGIPADATLTAAGPWGKGSRKPIVFYGTSILQGACASRPGMVHSSILGRRFQFPTINLGFSGNGRMEPVMADLLAELDPSVYVLDCLPNMTPAQVTERVEPFVHTLRKAHPQTPIVLVEDRVTQNSFLVESLRKKNEQDHAALKVAYNHLKKEGVKNLYYICGDDLLGNDGEGAVDGSHPNDLGFMRQADIFAKTLGPILKKQSKE